MNNNFSDRFVIVSIILLVLFLLKGLMYSTYLAIDYLDYNKTNGFFKNIYDFIDKYLIYVSDFVDTILLFIASYIVFFRKNNSILTTIFCFMLIIKFMLHFLIYRGILKYLKINLNLNLSNDTKEKLLQFKTINTFLTNIGLFFIAGYMLNIIFLK